MKKKILALLLVIVFMLPISLQLINAIDNTVTLTTTANNLDVTNTTLVPDKINPLSAYLELKIHNYAGTTPGLTNFTNGSFNGTLDGNPVTEQYLSVNVLDANNNGLRFNIIKTGGIYTRIRAIKLNSGNLTVLGETGNITIAADSLVTTARVFPFSFNNGAVYFGKSILKVYDSATSSTVSLNNLPELNSGNLMNVSFTLHSVAADYNCKISATTSNILPDFDRIPSIPSTNINLYKGQDVVSPADEQALDYTTSTLISGVTDVKLPDGIATKPIKEVGLVYSTDVVINADVLSYYGFGFWLRNGAQNVRFRAMYGDFKTVLVQKWNNGEGVPGGEQYPHNVALTAGKTVNLTVVVRSTNFSVWIDGDLVVDRYSLDNMGTPIYAPYFCAVDVKYTNQSLKYLQEVFCEYDLIPTIPSTNENLYKGPNVTSPADEQVIDSTSNTLINGVTNVTLSDNTTRPIKEVGLYYSADVVINSDVTEYYGFGFMLKNGAQNVRFRAMYGNLKTVLVQKWNEGQSVPNGDQYVHHAVLTAGKTVKIITVLRSTNFSVWIDGELVVDRYPLDNIGTPIYAPYFCAVNVTYTNQVLKYLSKTQGNQVPTDPPVNPPEEQDNTPISINMLNLAKGDSKIEYTNRKLNINGGVLSASILNYALGGNPPNFPTSKTGDNYMAFNLLDENTKPSTANTVNGLRFKLYKTGGVSIILELYKISAGSAFHIGNAEIPRGNLSVREMNMRFTFVNGQIYSNDSLLEIKKDNLPVDVAPYIQTLTPECYLSVEFVNANSDIPTNLALKINEISNNANSLVTKPTIPATNTNLVTIGKISAPDNTQEHIVGVSSELASDGTVTLFDGTQKQAKDMTVYYNYDMVINEDVQSYYGVGLLLRSGTNSVRFRFMYGDLKTVLVSTSKSGNFADAVDKQFPHKAELTQGKRYNVSVLINKNSLTIWLGNDIVVKKEAIPMDGNPLVAAYFCSVNASIENLKVYYVEKTDIKIPAQKPVCKSIETFSKDSQISSPGNKVTNNNGVIKVNDNSLNEWFIVNTIGSDRTTLLKNGELIRQADQSTFLKMRIVIKQYNPGPDGWYGAGVVFRASGSNPAAGDNYALWLIKNNQALIAKNGEAIASVPFEVNLNTNYDTEIYFTQNKVFVWINNNLVFENIIVNSGRNMFGVWARMANVEMSNISYKYVEDLQLIKPVVDNGVYPQDPEKATINDTILKPALNTKEDSPVDANGTKVNLLAVVLSIVFMGLSAAGFVFLRIKKQ